MSSFRTSIGGQAVMEGISMRGPENTCLCVRKPDGSIYKEIKETKKNRFERIPIIRGVAALCISLESGYSQLIKSSEIAFPDEGEDKFDMWIKKHFGENNKFINYVVALLAGFLSIGLFMFLPTFLTGVITSILPFLTPFRTITESLLKILIFIGYIYLASKTPDVRRVFQYHGAEHKTIFCYENNEELNIENVKKYGRFHPRCGTSFMFITLLISIFIFSFIPWDSTIKRVLYKLLSLPIIMGISYECIRYSGKHDNLLSRILSYPGLMIQRLTVFEPDEKMIEVAISAMQEVLPAKDE